MRQSRERERERIEKKNRGHFENWREGGTEGRRERQKEKDGGRGGKKVNLWRRNRKGYRRRRRGGGQDGRGDVSCKYGLPLQPPLRFLFHLFHNLFSPTFPSSLSLSLSVLLFLARLELPLYHSPMGRLSPLSSKKKEKKSFVRPTQPGNIKNDGFIHVVVK